MAVSHTSAVADADKTTHLRCVWAKQTAVENTADDLAGLLCTINVSHKAAMAALSCVSRMDVDAAEAVLNDIVLALGDKAGGVSPGGVDVANHGKVGDGRVLGTMEGSAVVFIERLAFGATVESQGVTVAIEVACKKIGVMVIIAGTHHRGDADVGAEFEVLPAEIPFLRHFTGNRIPLLLGGDDVGIFGSTLASEAYVFSRYVDNIFSSIVGIDSVGITA